MTALRLTRRGYLQQLGLAGERGPFNRKARAALQSANAQGIVFADDPSERSQSEPDNERASTPPSSIDSAAKAVPYSPSERDRLAAELRNVLATLPETHSAFLALQLPAIVARHTLAHEYPAGHLGFMAIGPSSTGKSALAQITCRILGLDPGDVTLYLARQAAGNMLGRRYRRGAEWTFVPPPETRHPFVFVDEYDKSDENVRRASLAYFQGDIHAQIEGRRYRLAPTPMLAANYSPGDGNPYSMLRPEYRRRSVLLDTRNTNRRDIESAVRRFHSDHPAPLLDVERVPEPARLSDAAMSILSTAPLLLTASGDEEYPGGRSLEIATRGYAGLFHLADDTEAALAVVRAYLLVSETQTGTVREGWRRDHDLIAAHPEVDAETLAQLITRAPMTRGRAAVEPRKSQAELDRERLALAVRRDELVEALRDTRDYFDPRTAPEHLRSATVRMRSVWRELATMAEAATTPARLGEISERANEYALAAETLHEQLRLHVAPVEDTGTAELADPDELAPVVPQPVLLIAPGMFGAVQHAMQIFQQRREATPRERTLSAPALPGTPAIPGPMSAWSDQRLDRTQRVFR